MKLMQKFKRGSSLKETFTRFPLVILALALSTLLWIAVGHNAFPAGTFLTQLVAYLFCMAVALVSARLFVEGHSWKEERALCLYGIVAMMVAALIFIQKNYGIAIAYLLPGLILSLIVAPYLNRKVNETACCQFNSGMAVSVFYAVLASGILTLGIVALLASIEYLFEVKALRPIYQDVFILIGMFFAPVYALSGIPKTAAKVDKKQAYPKGIIFIISYILAPLIVAYFVILYAYFAKILITWNLPKGNIATMVVLFGAVGITTHLFAFPIEKNANIFLRLVRQYFYPALLVPVLMLFVAVGVRVGDYGVTEQRYALILLGLWMAGIAIYLIVTRQQNLKIVVSSIAALLILASFGPWGASSVSAFSQTYRLKSILTDAGILENGQVVPAKARTLDEEKRSEVASIVYYLSQREKTDCIKKWFGPKSYLHTTNDKEVNSALIMKDMGITSSPVQEAYSPESEEPREQKNFWASRNTPAFVEVGGFTYFTSVQNAALKEGSYEQQIRSSDGLFTLRVEQNSVSLRDEAGRLVKFDVLPLLKWAKANKPRGAISDSDARRFVFTRQSEGLKAKLVVTSLNGTALDSGQPGLNFISFTLLIQPAGR